MPRVLQLLSSGADYQVRRCVEHLRRPLSDECAIDVRTIGPGGTYRSAVAAIRGLRSAAGEDRIIHAWGATALAVAALAGDGAIIHTPDALMRRRHLRLIRAVGAYRVLQVVVPTATMQRSCVEAGWPVARCSLIRPGVDFARVRARRDRALRQALGLGTDDRVMLAAGESTEAAAHSDAAWAAGILHVLDERYRLLIWGRGDQTGRLLRFAERQQRPGLLTNAEQRLGRALEYEELLPAADLIIISARSAIPALPIAVSMAAGLPIVAAITPTVGELLEDRHTALLTMPASPRHLAQRILDLEQDPSLQWSIADTARAEAYRYLSLTRFLDQHRTLYDQVARKVAVDLTSPATAPPQAAAQ